MDAMAKCAKQIRAELKKNKITNRDASVRCRQDYCIMCENKSMNMPNDKLLEIVEKIYRAEKHLWLCVFVNGRCLL